MKVDNIFHPWVYTDTGERLGVNEFTMQPRKGDIIGKLESGKYAVLGSNVDENCPGNQCPVK